MKKNIVICCDGTGNQLGETYSNVVKLFSVIAKTPDKQIAFYDPGIGTLSYPDTVLPLWRKIKKGLALAFGTGLEQNVSEAYSFLMENYQKGDDIYLFGFSRGAYTVRVLAGLIKEMGLLEKGCQNLIPYAWDSYRLCFNSNIGKIAHQFKSYFSRDVKIHFMGIWDTVSSIGFLKWKTYPHTFKNDHVLFLRHALAIDERRRFYRQNIFARSNDQQDIKQIWFAGVHSDVGGSYPLHESGLSQITLQWMIREADFAGLVFDKEMLKKVMPEIHQPDNSAPDYTAKIHKSLSGPWWILEIWPKKNRQTGNVFSPFGARRKMFLDPLNNAIKPTIHISVKNRIDDPNCQYEPENLLKMGKDYSIEN